MNFQEKVKSRLSCYKEKELGITEFGTYNYQGRIVNHPHILPEKKEKLNILKEYRERFFEDQRDKKKSIKLHKDFKHLNSSQAMCINFFYPLIEENKLNLITNYLGLPNEVILESVFEKDSHIDGVNGHRPTNFDFYIKTKSNKNIFFEIKYTESEFGKAKNDTEHINKYNEVYDEHKDKVTGATYANKEEFFKDYQVLRNLIHIDEDSYVVFIYPFGNKKIRDKAEEVLQKIESGKKYANHFKAIRWGELLDNIFPNLHSRKLIEHFKEFDFKYL